MLNTEQVRSLAVKYGADLCGVAATGGFSKLQQEANPLLIKPDAKSVIVLGFRITRGGLRGVEEGTAWNTMSLGCPSHQLIETTYLLCCAIESAGYEAIPIYNHPRELRNQGVSVAAGKPESDVILSFDHAASLAGLGRMGKGKFFLTPEFGPRQIFTAIITDAELEPGKAVTEDLCAGCNACAAACPSFALDTKNTSSAEISKDIKADWFTLHTENCRVCRTGAIPNNYCADAEPLRVGAACGRACVASLEKRKILKNKFVNNFRNIA